MTPQELVQLIQNGETSTIQFKRDVTNALSIAQEMVAMANSKGGKILIGIDDKSGAILGLEYSDIQRINNLLSTAAQDHVKSPIIITTDTIRVDSKAVIVASIPEGTDKPHTDKDGLIFIKNGSDKRKVTSREELARMLQYSGNLYAEDMIVAQSSYSDIITVEFQEFFERKYGETYNPEELPRYLENLRLGSEGRLNVAGSLLFGRRNDTLLPDFFITAIWFRGNDKTVSEYVTSENIRGNIPYQFMRGLGFLQSTVLKVQGGQNFNSLGIPEIPNDVFIELLTNALIHRNYFIKDSIKLFAFDDRIEIISPGSLPNSLTVEQIKRGLRKTRNAIIASFAPDVTKYRGIGSGILRALKAYPAIEFYNDPEAEEFKVVIKKPMK